jgi:hypothetical protein
VYETPLSSFANDAVPGPVFTVPVVEQGRAALEAIDAVRKTNKRPPWHNSERLVDR